MSRVDRIGMNSIQPPKPMDLFSRTDSDRSGGISQNELQNLSEKIQERTGKTIEAGDEVFNDADGLTSVGILEFAPTNSMVEDVGGIPLLTVTQQRV